MLYPSKDGLKIFKISNYRMRLSCGESATFVIEGEVD